MLTAWIQRDIHIVLILILVFLIYPARKKGERGKATVFDWLLILLALASGAYIIINYQAIVLRLGIPTTSDIVFGIIMVLLILEASRRATGWVLVIIAGVLLLYNFIGPWIPGIMGHKGYSLSRVISQMYLTTEGIFSTPLGVSASYIFLFVFLTSMLEKIGMGDFLLELAMAVMGRYVGGPAKTAVLASGFMGTLSGSAVANVVGTGTFTIPLMKRNGYLPFFAGAVEAAASSGGQLMPPIMGAAAFIIAEFLAFPTQCCNCSSYPGNSLLPGGSFRRSFRSLPPGVKRPAERTAAENGAGPEKRLALSHSYRCTALLFGGTAVHSHPLGLLCNSNCRSGLLFSQELLATGTHKDAVLTAAQTQSLLRWPALWGWLSALTSQVWA